METDLENLRFLLDVLLKKVAEIESRMLSEDESNDLQGEGVKSILPSNIINISIGLEVLLVLKLLGHTDILTEDSNLIDEVYEKSSIQKIKTISKCCWLISFNLNGPSK